MSSSSNDLAESVDLAAHLRLLRPDATVRGMYIQDVRKRLAARLPGQDIDARVGLPVRRYLPFNTYPYADYLRLCAGAVPFLWPDHPPAEGLRLLGEGAYDTFLSSQIGAVLLGVFGRSFPTVARAAGKAWGVSLNFGTVEVVDVGPGQMRFEMREMPAFLGTLQRGVILGAMKATGVVGGTVEPQMHSLSSATMDVRWNGSG